MRWEDRPEQQAIARNPHNTKNGRIQHVFAKVDGDWVCRICYPEKFQVMVPEGVAAHVDRLHRRGL